MLEAYRRNLQAKGAVVRSLDGEITFVVADGASNKNAVGDGEQLNGSLRHGLAELSVDKLTADCKAAGFVVVGLCECRRRHQEKENKSEYSE